MKLYRWIKIGREIVYLFALFGLAAVSLRAQDASVISQERFIRITPVYQSFDSDTFSEASQTGAVIELYVPFNRQTALFLRTGQASFKANSFPGLSGFGDTQLSAQYYLIDSHILIQATVNLPTGKQKLSTEEFKSSIALGHSYYDFKIPNMGQGLNAAPGVSWAGPVSDKLVLGVGTAYQINGSFQPLADFDGKYKPGNEWLITGGVDYQLSAVSTLSADLIVSLYGTDKFDTTEVYKSGTKLVASLQYQRYFGFNHLQLLARYRSRAKSFSVSGGELVAEAEKTYPDYLFLSGQYTLRMNQETRLGMFLENRHFLHIVALESLNLVGVGLAPAYQAGSRLTLLGRLKYQTGSFKSGDKMTGLVVSAGVKYVF
jgi:hypothetical protein